MEQASTPLSPVLDNRSTEDSLISPLLAPPPPSSGSFLSRRSSASSRWSTSSPVVLHMCSLLDDALIGMAISVSWSYVLIQQLDSTSDCPAVGDDRLRCWLLVIALATNTFLGVFYLPAITIFILRVTNRRIASLRQLGSAGPDDSRYERRISVAKRVQRLATSAASICWSTGASSTVYYLLSQLETEATNGSFGGFGPGPLGPRGLQGLPPPPTPPSTSDLPGPPRPPDDDSDGSCSATELSTYVPKVLGPVLAIFIGVCAFIVLVQTLACRALGRPMSGYMTEVNLLLSRSLYCAFATAFMSFPSLVLVSYRQREDHITIMSGTRSRSVRLACSRLLCS